MSSSSEESFREDFILDTFSSSASFISSFAPVTVSPFVSAPELPLFNMEGDDFAGDSTTTGTITVGGTAEGRVDANDDRDWFAIAVSDGDTVIFAVETLNGSAETYSLFLREADQTFLGGDGSTSTNTAVTFVDAGTYYVDIGSAAVGAEYRITATAGSDDFAGDSSTAGTITDGGSASGRIESTNDEDWFAIDLTDGTTLEVSVPDTADNPFIVFYDASENQLLPSSTDFNFAEQTDIFRLETPATSTYYVAVVGAQTGTDYTVSARTFADDFGATISTVGNISAAGETVSGSFDFNGDNDWFRVDLTRDEGVLFTGSPTGGDVTGVSFSIFDENGLPVSGGQGQGANASFAFAPTTSGTYYIAVEPLGNGTGTYTLTSAQIEDDFGDDAASGGSFVPNEIFTGQSGFENDIDRFSVDVAAGDVVRLDLLFDSDDGFLIPTVFDDNGNEVSAGFDIFNTDTFAYRFDTAGTYFFDLRGGNADANVPLDYTVVTTALPDYNVPAALTPSIPAGSVVLSPVPQVGPVPDVMPVVTSVDLFRSVEPDGTIVENLFFRLEEGETLYSSFSAPTGSTSLITSIDEGVIENAGLMWVEENLVNSLAIGGGNLTNDGTIVSIGKTASFGYNGSGKLTNTGNITATSDDGFASAYQTFFLSIVGVDTDLVTNTGSIEAFSQRGDGFGVTFAREAQFENSGFVSGSGFTTGIGVRFLEGGRFENDGTVVAIANDILTNSAGVFSPFFSLDVTNTGTIAADIAILGASIDTVVNQNIIQGDIILVGSDFSVSGIDDRLTNSGLVDGNIDLDGSDDIYIGAGGQVTGTIFLGDGNDQATGGSGIDVISGGADNDLIFGGIGRDILDGGSGRDEIHGGVSADTITGGSQDDRLFGEAGNDNISGNGGGDFLTGDAGNDTLSGGGGRDTLEGGLGNDHLIGGDSADTLSGGDDDDLIEGRRGSDNISGGEGNDTLIGNGLRDIITGDGGDDIIRGGGGTDTLIGGSGADDIFGGAGTDSLDGGSEDDLLVGGGGNDTLLGGTGNDTLIGGGGSDTLSGGSGIDILTGNAAADTFVFAVGHEQVEITDFRNNQDALDLTDFGFANISEATALMSEAGGSVTFALNSDVLVINNISIAELTDDITI